MQEEICRIPDFTRLSLVRPLRATKCDALRSQDSNCNRQLFEKSPRAATESNFKANVPSFSLLPANIYIYIHRHEYVCVSAFSLPDHGNYKTSINCLMAAAFVTLERFLQRTCDR